MAGFAAARATGRAPWRSEAGSNGSFESGGDRLREA